MKKLLALSIALLTGCVLPEESLNLYGAEKPIYSPDGLEGWGKEEGVYIIVEDYSKRDKTYDVKAITNQVELKLRLAGIKVNKDALQSIIIINMQPIRIEEEIRGYSLNIRAGRRMTFKYNGKEYNAWGSCKATYSGITPPNYRPDLDKYLDQLLLDYLKANPKAFPFEVLPPKKKKTPEEKALKDSALGEYKLNLGKGPKLTTHQKWVLLENGIIHWYANGKKLTEGKWEITGKEIHIEWFRDPIGNGQTMNGKVFIYKINTDKSLENIAVTREGKREAIPKDNQRTFKKIN